MELNAKQQELLDALDRAVQARVDHARAVKESNIEIASLCADARDEGIIMRVLAAHVKRYDARKDEAVTVTRQALDELISEHQGRRPPRRERRRDKKATSNGGGRVNSKAFL